MATKAQTASALSSTGLADSSIAATSLRGPVRGEVHAIAVGASSKTYVVPDEWRGIFVRVQAEGADLYIQVSTSATPATCDKAARSGEAGSPVVLTAPAGGCYRVADGDSEDMQFPPDATTFAIQASGSGCARCHPSET